MKKRDFLRKSGRERGGNGGRSATVGKWGSAGGGERGAAGPVSFGALTSPNTHIVPIPARPSPAPRASRRSETSCATAPLGANLVPPHAVREEWFIKGREGRHAQRHEES